MLPSFSDIVYFLEVAQSKNISRAAERLGITQPSLSAAIKRLESSVGTPLFLRSRSGVQLTKSGELFYSKSRSLLSGWEQLRTEVSKKQFEVSGQYIIGCHPAVALYSLPLFLPKLIQQNPDLQIQLIHDLSRKITERVISFEIDFGIVVNPVKHPDLVISELCKDEVSFWVSKKATPSQKQKNDVIICDPNLIQSQKLLNELGKDRLPYSRVISSSDLEVISNLTECGAGVGLLPKRVATRKSPCLLELLDPSLPTFKDRICLIYRADFQKSKAAQLIVKSIRASF